MKQPESYTESQTSIIELVEPFITRFRPLSCTTPGVPFVIRLKFVRVKPFNRMVVEHLPESNRYNLSLYTKELYNVVRIKVFKTLKGEDLQPTIEKCISGEITW